MSAPFVVVIFTIFPHFFKSVIRFIGFVQACKHNGNAKHHKQLMLQVFLQHGFPHIIQMESTEAFFCHQDLMTVPLRHNALLYRLIGSADPISIQICIHVEHPLHIRKHLIDHQVVLVKHMLRQRFSRFPHHIRPEGAGVDRQHLVHPEGLCFPPPEDPVLR